MQQIISSIVQFLQQGIAAIFKFLELVWTWSFGQIIAVFQSDWKSLPVWKIVILVATENKKRARSQHTPQRSIFWSFAIKP